MKKKTKNTIALSVLFVIGLSILLYPSVSNKWNEYRANRLIINYNQVVRGQDPDTFEKERELAREYNQKLEQGRVPDSFAVRDGIEDKEYESLLNISGDGIMGYVEIPAISVQIPIYHYTTDESLEKGAGHLNGSSLPVGGENTHAVITAHRGLPSAKLFTDLNLLEEGSRFYLHVLGEVLAYEVDSIMTVEPEETDSLALQEGKDLATLVTCTPYGVNTHRLLVHGHRVEYTEDEKDQELPVTQKLLKNRESILMKIACVILGCLIAVVAVWIIQRRDRRKLKKKN